MTSEDHEDVVRRRLPPIAALRRALDVLNPSIRQDATCGRHRNDAAAPELLGQLLAHVEQLLAGIDPHDEWARQDVTHGYIAVVAGRDGHDDEELRHRRAAAAYTERLGMLASLLGAAHTSKVAKPQKLTLAGDVAEVAAVIAADARREMRTDAVEHCAPLADRLEALAALVRRVAEEEQRDAREQRDEVAGVMERLAAHHEREQRAAAEGPMS